VARDPHLAVAGWKARLMTDAAHGIRLGADIGGTFTDLVLDVRGRLFSTKLLTSYSAPEQPILDGIEIVARDAGISPSEVGLLIHGTTLATNALIERRGARTAFVTTEGYRDVIEMRTESRYDQYDLDIVLPTPLIPRQDRFPVAGRIDANGRELRPLDEAALERLGRHFASVGYESIAIGFIHAYANPEHERRAREILRKYLKVPISISAEVSPQMREYERFNTVCANAYVRPRMETYLTRLKARLGEIGVGCPVFMIHSGGGLVSVETACEYPVRLVESGPAGGAIFAADIAGRFSLDKVVSYDMGGTTAKICLIEGQTPKTARTLEVARTARFAKGSGMPVSIPVIEMIEIGAGGGSIAWIDAMGRIRTGPESAGSEPGPACYGRGGTKPTITDADLILGKIDPEGFAGGTIALDAGAATKAVASNISERLSLAPLAAAFGICEMVDENMANAARVHAVENGKNVSENLLVAFGGAAPLHAARICEKLGIDDCLVPEGAGVGSAIGFLRAPFGYEAVASRVVPLSEFDAHLVNGLLDELKATAEGFVRQGSDGEITTEITAFMRYAGQGWEIPVALPNWRFADADGVLLQKLFKKAYAAFFGRAIDGLDGLEILVITWSVKTQDRREAPPRQTLRRDGKAAATSRTRKVFDPVGGAVIEYAVHDRTELHGGVRVLGPALIIERETTTVVTSTFDAVIQDDGSILLARKGAQR
jgi:N-methylhydantoinase A